MDFQLTGDAAARCAAACDQFSTEVSALAKYVSDGTWSGGFGALPSGIALAQKYSNLTHGPEGSLASMLAAHITVATNLRKAFLAAGVGYEATEDAVTSHITQSGPR